MKKLNLTLFSLSFFIILTFISYSSENVISGKAQIVDGDTIKINKKKNKTIWYRCSRERTSL